MCQTAEPSNLVLIWQNMKQLMNALTAEVQVVQLFNRSDSAEHRFTSGYIPHSDVRALQG